MGGETGSRRRWLRRGRRPLSRQGLGGHAEQSGGRGGLAATTAAAEQARQGVGRAGGGGRCAERPAQLRALGHQGARGRCADLHGLGGPIILRGGLRLGSRRRADQDTEHDSGAN